MGRIFAHWVIIYFWYSFENEKVAILFWLLVSTVPQQMAWAIFGRFFSNQSGHPAHN
jgi:hypothetical protein